MLEKNIEAEVGRQVKEWSRDIKLELHYLKLTIVAGRGWPDRLILCPNRGALFIEFKRPGEQPRKLQLHIHAILRKLGFEVQIHDDVNIAVAAIKTYVDATARAGAGHEADSGGQGG